MEATNSAFSQKLAQLVYTNLHLQKCDEIYHHILKKEWKKLGLLLKSLSYYDQNIIYYAFLDKYDFPFWQRIYSEVKDYKLLKSYGLV